MSTPNDVPELLRKGIEAAREGKRSEAHDLFQQVIELDEKNEKGWFWLASVVDSDEERRICLGNVLHINPNNERAKRALDALQAKVKEKKAADAVIDDEVVAGVSRKQMTLVIGVGAAVIILILVVALVVIVGNGSRQAADSSTQAAVAQLATGSVETATAVIIQAAGTAEAGTATQLAIATPVPPTRSIPTLPPTWTPTPQATIPATRETLPLPTGLTGRLAAWGGQDLLNVGYLPLGYYDFDQGSRYAQIGTSYGANISFATNGQRVVYTVYDNLLFAASLEAVNVNGTQLESIPARWTGQTALSPFEPAMPDFGPNGLLVVFVARTATRQTPQVFLLNLNAAAGEDPLRQLTDDDTTYSYPILSPDASKVIAIRADPNSANPTIDLVNIDVQTTAKIPVTNDALSFSEAMPYFTGDGLQVVYAAEASNAPGNHDIYVRSADGSGTASAIYATPADEINPVLSPDGRFLAFASNAAGRYDIYVYDLNAQTLSQLTDTPSEDEFPGDWWQS
ncbi:MAG: hypothetical protein ABI835_00370 [Chloroflexota bacterium]